MSRKNRRGLFAAAALATLALGASAHAATVEYYTEGFLSGGTSSNLGGDQYQDVWTDADTSITFIGQNDNTIPGVGGNVTTARLGSFNVSALANAVDPISLTFTLDLYQIIPNVGGAKSELIGAATGTITDSLGPPNSVGTSNLLITFNPNAFPQVAGSSFAYNVASSTLIQSGTSPTNTTLDGGVTQVPLPSTASAGLISLGGLGLVGGLKKLRERNALRAV